MEILAGKKPRRKWRYSSREAAEAEVIKAREGESLLDIAAHGMLRNEVTWLRGPSYDAGIVGKDRMDGGVVILVWHGSKQASQKPSMDVFWADKMREMRQTIWHVTDPLSVEYRDLLDNVIKELSCP